MIRIGILGAAKIAPLAMINPAGKRDDTMVQAVAARDTDRANTYAETHAIPHVAENYDALIARDDIDLIYNALPPHRHEDLSIAALKAGKPVLCEKPFAPNAAGAARMAAAAEETGVFLMEAFHYRFHPAFQTLLEAAHDIGEILHYDGWFTVEIPYRDGELRHDPLLGGGALMDLGCYPLHWARALLGSEPEVLSCTAREGQPGIDLSLTARLMFGGTSATVHTSMAPGALRGAALRLIGHEATLDMVNPLAPQLGYQISRTEPGGKTEIIAAAGPSDETTYDYQLAHTIACLTDQAAPLLPVGDAVANMTAIDAMYEAAGLAVRG